MSELIQPVTATITKQDIERLFPLVNTGRDTYVNLASHQFVDKIIELWFEEKGYDFWDNPYPDVLEWCVNKDQEIELKYVNS